MRGKIATIAAVAALLAAGPGRAVTFDQVYAFGDSLTDVGNDFAGSGGKEPPPPYYDGRFSNGPIWIDHLGGIYGLSMKPSLTGGTDYAFGGAETTADASIDGLTIPSLPHQLDAYLAGHSHADPKALYVIWGGGNDVLDQPATGLAAKFASATATMVSNLKKAGAIYFLVPGVPDVGLAPEVPPSKKAAASATSAALNAALDKALASATLKAGITIYRTHPFTALDAIVKGKTHFGFTNVTTPCFNGSTVCKDPDHTLFWDNFHPTEFGHSLVAMEAETVLMP